MTRAALAAVLAVAGADDGDDDDDNDDARSGGLAAAPLFAACIGSDMIRIYPNVCVATNKRISFPTWAAPRRIILFQSAVFQAPR